MNIGTVFCFLACLFLLQQDPVRAWRPEYDGGAIETVSEGKLYVRGSRGRHIFEPIRMCSWREAGIDVLITFRGLTRAALRPKLESFSGRPVKAFILRDGRE